MRDYAIYRIDLDTFQASVSRLIIAESAYEAVKEARKFSVWSRQRGFESAWVYRDVTDSV